MNVLRNEFLKLHAKKGSYMFAIFLVVVSGISLVVAKKWLPQELKVDSPLDFANMNVDSLLSFIALYGVVLGAKIVAEEFQKGTIKQLLIRPQKRVFILLSKYITVILAIVLMVMFAAAVSLLLGSLAFGGETNLTAGIYSKILVYQLPRLIFYATFSFLFATLFRSAVIPIVAVIFVLFSENIVMMLLGGYKWAKFLFVFHLYPSIYDSNPLVNHGMKPMFADFSMAASLLLVAAYIGAFLITAAAVFRKRDIL